MQPSGYGKTTLFRLLAGLEKPEQKCSLSGFSSVTYMFQEDRLLEKESTIHNILLPKLGVYGISTSKKLELVEACEDIIKSGLLSEEALFDTAGTLSGGMKRRVALLRTMLYEDKKDSLCLLDEPFTGMDEKTRAKAIEFIKEKQNGRTIILATHNEEDVLLLGGVLWKPELH